MCIESKLSLIHIYLFVFPTVFVAYTLLVIKTLPYFIRPHDQSDYRIFGLSREESASYFRFQLTLHAIG